MGHEPNIWSPNQLDGLTSVQQTIFSTSVPVLKQFQTDSVFPFTDPSATQGALLCKAGEAAVAADLNKKAFPTLLPSFTAVKQVPDIRSYHPEITSSPWFMVTYAC